MPTSYIIMHLLRSYSFTVSNANIHRFTFYSIIYIAGKKQVIYKKKTLYFFEAFNKQKKILLFLVFT